MKESITGRVARIISGGANALIDAIENAAPEAVMEEAIREIDGAIDEVRAELGRTVANKHLANSRLMDENSKHTELAAKIEVAVNENRDDLAEAAIAAQLDIEAQIPVLENVIADCSAKEREFEGYIRALQAKKHEMKNEFKRFRESRMDMAGAVSEAGTATGASSIDKTVTKAGNAFDRVLEKATGITVAATGISSENSAKLAELEDIARRNRIQERLAAVKRDTSDKVQ